MLPTRPLGRTSLSLPILSFGASSLGQEFRSVSLDEVLRSVRVALEGGLNFLIARGYTGQTTENFFPSDIQEVVGVRVPSYASVSLTYRFGRSAGP